MKQTQTSGLEYPKDILRTSDFDKLKAENKKLLDSNRELLETMQLIWDEFHILKAKEAINNAKNI